jgi:hypothetical protein
MTAVPVPGSPKKTTKFLDFVQFSGSHLNDDLIVPRLAHKFCELLKNDVEFGHRCLRGLTKQSACQFGLLPAVARRQGRVPSHNQDTAGNSTSCRDIRRRCPSVGFPACGRTKKWPRKPGHSSIWCGGRQSNPTLLWHVRPIGGSLICFRAPTYACDVHRRLTFGFGGGHIVASAADGCKRC